jgi:hypothetical protein
MKQAATDDARDGDAIPVDPMAVGKPGPKLDARIESLAEVGVTQSILATFAPPALRDVATDPVSRSG